MNEHDRDAAFGQAAEGGVGATPAARNAPAADDGRMPLAFWVGLAVGAPIAAFGVWTVQRTSRDTHPATLIRWVVGLGVGHDAIVVPIVVAVAAIVDRIVPRGHRALVRGSLAVSAMVVALGWPATRRYGRRPDNPSILPRAYGRNVVIAVALVWAFTALMIAVRMRRARTGAPREPRDEAGSAPR